MSVANGNGHGSIAGKVYVAGRLDARGVPIREIVLSDDTSFRVYDTSGPYTDPHFTPDVRAGLPRLRRDWIASRGDVEPYDARTASFEIDGWTGGRPPVVHAKPGLAVTQMHYARRGEITPEM